MVKVALLVNGGNGSLKRAVAAKIQNLLSKQTDRVDYHVNIHNCIPIKPIRRVCDALVKISLSSQGNEHYGKEERRDGAFEKSDKFILR